MRRNSDYQQDYKWFISQWRALEQDYGVPPDNDLQAWKQNPRSYKIIDLDSEQDKSELIMTSAFDLTKSLKEQLETIKKQLVVAQYRFKKQGKQHLYRLWKTAIMASLPEIIRCPTREYL